MPGPFADPVPVPTPDPTPPPLPGPAPAAPLVPAPLPGGPVVAAPVGGCTDGVWARGTAAGGTTGTGFGSSTGTGATSAAASGAGGLMRTNCKRCAAPERPPPEPPPPPPAGPAPPPPTAGSALKLLRAIGNRTSKIISACAKREAATPFHRPSLLLRGTPTGARYRLPMEPPDPYPSETHRSP